MAIRQSPLAVGVEPTSEGWVVSRSGYPAHADAHFRTKARALAEAESYCGYLAALGYDSRLTIFRKNKSVQREREYAANDYR